MPTICIFFGIVIRMYFDDHEPAHFHAVYGEYQAIISIDTLEILRGKLPRRALELVLDWAELHQAELRENWKLARSDTELKNIAPLE